MATKKQAERKSAEVVDVSTAVEDAPKPVERQLTLDQMQVHAALNAGVEA